MRRSIPRHAILTLAALLLAALCATAVAESTETSVIMGKESFRSYCASCHGTEARGDGSVAEHLRVKPADLTRISQRNHGEFPADQVFQTIDGRKPARGHGNRDMPIWGDAFRLTRDNPDEAAVKAKINDLVHFLESIQED
ncbi:MAG: c-type cytochrome [Acidobacteriota bacterium]